MLTLRSHPMICVAPDAQELDADAGTTARHATPQGRSGPGLIRSGTATPHVPQQGKARKIGPQV